MPIGSIRANYVISTHVRDNSDNCFTLVATNRHFSEANTNAIDQTWYKRAVDQYAVEPESFVYSVPFGAGTGNLAATLVCVPNLLPRHLVFSSNKRDSGNGVPRNFRGERREQGASSCCRIAIQVQRFPRDIFQHHIRRKRSRAYVRRVTLNAKHIIILAVHRRRVVPANVQFRRLGVLRDRQPRLRRHFQG